MNFTFGIITNNANWVLTQRVITSIYSLSIPKDKFEIIVVHDQRDVDLYYNKGLEKHISIPDEKPAWITKKKNLICQQAKFNNVVLLHDYIAFDPYWYKEFVKFGDDWDVCMNQILNGDGTRFRDWVTWEPPIHLVPYDRSNLTRSMYVSGSYWVAKTQFMLDNPLDENLCWGQGEDVEWSLRVRNKWNYRMNAGSIVKCLKQKDTHVQGIIQ